MTDSLYVHMAVLLNKIFFSPDNPYSVKVLSAFAYCSTFVFRPFGALFFGWLGDTIGRKPIIIITTIMMACTCIGMAILPSYNEIGFTATVLVTLFRAIQGRLLGLNFILRKWLNLLCNILL